MQRMVNFFLLCDCLTVNETKQRFLPKLNNVSFVFAFYSCEWYCNIMYGQRNMGNIGLHILYRNTTITFKVTFNTHLKYTILSSSRIIQKYLKSLSPLSRDKAPLCCHSNFFTNNGLKELNHRISSTSVSMIFTGELPVRCTGAGTSFITL